MTVLGASPLRRAAAVTATSGALAAGMLTAAGPASAQAVTCGATLMSSVTLSSNLNCTHDTTSNALTIGAAGVTVNLNGHKILGPGDSAGTEGIVDGSGALTGSGTSGYSGLTVQNGTISNFYTDVDVEGVSGGDLTGVVLQHLTTTDRTPQESTAVNGDYLDGASIEFLTSRNAGTGINLDYGQDVTVSHNHMVAADYGIYEYAGSADTLSDNTMSGVIDDGISVADSPGDLVQGNTITGLGADGILYETENTTFTGNVLNNLYAGLYDNGGTSQDKNTISDNRGSGDGWGAYAGYPEDDLYTGNTFSHDQYGIETGQPIDTTLADNTTDDNSETGVYIYTTNTYFFSATLTGNTANGNRYGLYSGIPTSGTGNQASGNKVVNCYNVSCTNAASDQGGRIAAPPHRTPQVAPAVPPSGRR